MKQLPKPEYELMRALIAQYSLDDPCELFTALLRLAAETQQLTDTVLIDGAIWLQRIITETVADTRR